jgi:hypothetical protein
MPANHAPATLRSALVSQSVDGILAAPVELPSRWTALRHLRAGMTELRRLGHAPRVAFVYAISRDGRIVPGRDGDAVLLVLGYRLQRRRPGWAGGKKAQPLTGE